MIIVHAHTLCFHGLWRLPIETLIFVQTEMLNCISPIH